MLVRFCYNKSIMLGVTMLNIYVNENDRVVPGQVSDNAVWIDLVNPTTDELDYVAKKTGVFRDFLTTVLDAEESSRIDIEDEQILIIVNVAVQRTEMPTLFRTIPLGIIILDKFIITVSLEKLECLSMFRAVGNRMVNVSKQGQFTLQIIYQVITMYLYNLDSLDSTTDAIEEALYIKMEDNLFLDLLKIEKTLVYFRNSLRSNKNVIDKLFRSSYLTLYEEDEDLLDDINIELVQAMEMADTNAAIIRSIRDGISSLMSNKLNITMRTLAAITIIMTIPTIIFSFYGMNVNLGAVNSGFYAFIIIGVTILTMIIVYLIMKNQRFF